MHLDEQMNIEEPASRARHRVFTRALRKSRRRCKCVCRKLQFMQNSAEQEVYSPLVTVHVGLPGSVPVIFVPGAGGSVASGIGLVECSRAWATIYGLQSRGVNGSAVPHHTVQAAAAMYLPAIRQVQPCGPYRLVGHSFGGWVAFELGCRLAAAGAAVKPLVLLDSQAPTPPAAVPRRRDRVEVLGKLIHALEELSERSMNLTRDDLVRLDQEAQLSRLVQGMKALGVLPRSSDVKDIRGFVRIFEANLNTTYVPEHRFPGHALLFQPVACSHGVEGEGGCDAGAIREAWRNHVGYLEHIPVPGRHMTMLKKPYVDAIACHLSRVWNECRGAS
jgi:thioesterase domain-containing protein